MTKSSRPLLIVLTLITLVLLGIVVGGVYYIRGMNTKTAELLQAVDAEAQASLIAQSVREFKEKSQNDIDAFNRLVLTEDKSVELIEKIENAGKGLDLATKIASVQKIEGGSPSDPKVLQINIEAKGDWADAFTFLQALEALPYRVALERVVLNKEGELWSLNTVLSLNLFN